MLTTPRVRREQERTAPPQSRDAFRRAIAAGFLRIQAPPPNIPLQKYWGLADLSPVDVELVAWADQSKAGLFTDEKNLFRIARARAVEVYNLPRILKALRDTGRLTLAELRRIVADLPYGPDARTFTPAEKESLGLDRDA